MTRTLSVTFPRGPQRRDRVMARGVLRAGLVSQQGNLGEHVNWMCEPALRVRALSAQQHGEAQAVEMVGQSPAFLAAMHKVEKIARYREPVLITGESGVGKEHFAQAIFLLGTPKGRPYVSVNCPQYQEGNLTVSELFGHTKGSFTGAIADHSGAFEQADGGAIFLDEIGDLPSAAQAMLLRALATGEFRPLGATRSRSADVRVISATNRDLNELVLASQFRYDLFFRLRHFHLDLPPLRDRGDDWQLIVEHTLHRLARKYGVVKRLSPASLSLLERSQWPGNVRQLIGVVSTGYGMADGEVIEPDDFDLLLEESDRFADAVEHAFRRIVDGGEEFWRAVGQPFLDRDLNRSQVKAIVRKGLESASGNYRQVLELFHLPSNEYQRFMDFLRHHDLKP